MNRLFGKGLVTTLFGTAVLIFTGAMLWEGKSDMEGLAGWFLFGTTLLRAKDSILGIEDKNQP